MKKVTITRVRDAITGQFLPNGTEKRRPTTTVVETIVVKKPRPRP